MDKGQEVDVQRIKNNLKRLKGRVEKVGVESERVNLSKVQQAMVKAVTGEELTTVEVDGYNPKKEGLKKPKLQKKKPSSTRVIGTKKVVIDGKEVTVKVIPDGNQYFVGKNPPSGKPPRGTNSRSEEAYEVSQLRKLWKYCDRRADAAYNSEEQGRTRKGGLFEDWGDVLSKLERVKGLDQEDL